MSFLKKMLKETWGRSILVWTACLLFVYAFFFFLFSRAFFRDFSIETLFIQQLITSFIFLFLFVFFIGHGLMFSVHVMESKKNPWQAISFKKLFTTGLSFLFCQAGLTVLGICLILPFTMTTPHLAAFILLAYLLIIVTPYNLLFIQRLPENKLPAFRHTFEYFKKNWLHVLDITGAAVVLSLFFSYWGQFLNWISFSLVDLGQSTLFWSVNLLLLIFDLIVRVYLFFFFMYFAGMIAAKTRSDK